MAATTTTLAANYAAGSRLIQLTAYTAPAGRAKPILKVDDELFLMKYRRSGLNGISGVCAGNNLGTRNRVLTARHFGVQQGKCDRVDVRTIGSDGNTAE